MTKRVMSAAIALCIVSDANATLSSESYKEPSNEHFRTFNQPYLEGLKEGLLSLNALLVADGKPPVFCPPPELAITNEEAEYIVMRVAQSIADPDRYPISVLLAEGFKHTFPCGQGESNK